MLDVLIVCLRSVLNYFALVSILKLKLDSLQKMVTVKALAIVQGHRYLIFAVIFFYGYRGLWFIMVPYMVLILYYLFTKKHSRYVGSTSLHLISERL